jgi:uncharacterized protein DUF5996
MSRSVDARSELWPELPLEAWSDTYATLHRWMQIVGKIRLKQSPWVNHSWHVTLYVTPRGLTTSPIAYGSKTFELEFDFLEHRLSIHTSDGAVSRLPLEPQSVASFYKRLMRAMEELKLPVHIDPRPNEVPDAVRFDEDELHAAYDPEYANRFWRALVQADRVFKLFRARFIGKCSPVHFFWGGPDLAVTRFSGRRAPEHPGGIPNLPDWVAREAYSHEVSSCGFWPGSGTITYPAFYSYIYPEPDGFPETPIRPASAFYSSDLREFILPYDAVRLAQDPDATLLEFLQATYEAAANLASWDRSALEQRDAARQA